ncbi:adhesion domain-containing protein, partial [Lelliottia amnigena]
QLSSDKDKVTVGESINLTLQVRQSNGEVFTEPTTVSFIVESSVNRQGVSWTQNILANQSPIHSYSGITDTNGNLTVTLTEPNGQGVLSSIRAITNKGNSNIIESTFTVLTSPDSAFANMWGHMSEQANTSKGIYRRPYLAAEVTSDDSNTYQNESWAVFLYSTITARCSLPASSELITLFETYGRLDAALGWPIFLTYRSSTTSTPGYHENINMLTGSTNILGGDEVSYLLASCRI